MSTLCSFLRFAGLSSRALEAFPNGVEGPFLAKAVLAIMCDDLSEMSLPL